MSRELAIPASVVAAPALALFFPHLTDQELQSPIDHESFLVAERRAKIASLRRQRKSHGQIATILGISKSTVNGDIHAVLDGYRRLAAVDAAYHIADALDALDAHMADLKEQWEKSKEPRKESASSRRTAAGRIRNNGEPLAPGETETTSAKMKESLGDPRLAALWQQCWEKRCMLLGILNKADLKSAGPPPVKMIAGIDPAEVV